MEFWVEPPIVAWNRIARMLVEQAGLDLAGRARVLAGVNLAIADATLASLHWRFVLNAWERRWADKWVAAPDAPDSPVMARLEGTDLTISLRPETHTVVTSPMRNFPSIAATVAGAASAALAKAIESRHPGFTLSSCAPASGVGGSPGRYFADVAAAARECAFASSLDGWHTREACLAGYKLGEAIGNYVAKQTRGPQR
jgi:hypothetical protein